MISFSIITVSKNSAKTIRETLESLLNQNIENLEFLLIDGLSTDNTIKIAESYIRSFRKSNIDFKIYSEKDNGIYFAMNKGLKLAKGEWVGFINSDDYLEPNVLSKIKNSIVQNDISKVFYGDIKCKKNNKIRLCERSKKIKNINNEMEFFHPSVYVHKSVYKSLGVFDTNYKIAADWDLLKRFYNSGIKFSELDFPVATFKEGGVSSQNTINHLKERFSIRHKNKDWKFIFYDLKDILRFVLKKITW